MCSSDLGDVRDDVVQDVARVAQHVHQRSEEHTSELQSRSDLVCRLLLEKKKKKKKKKEKKKKKNKKKKNKKKKKKNQGRGARLLTHKKAQPRVGLFFALTCGRMPS